MIRENRGYSEKLLVSGIWGGSHQRSTQVKRLNSKLLFIIKRATKSGGRPRYQSVADFELLSKILVVKHRNVFGPGLLNKCLLSFTVCFLLSIQNVNDLRCWYYGPACQSTRARSKSVFIHFRPTSLPSFPPESVIVATRRISTYSYFYSNSLLFCYASQFSFSSSVNTPLSLSSR